MMENTVSSTNFIKNLTEKTVKIYLSNEKSIKGTLVGMDENYNILIKNTLPNIQNEVFIRGNNVTCILEAD